MKFGRCIVGIGYRWVVKPVLFRISPDHVHQRMVRFVCLMQRCGVLRWLARTTIATQPPGVMRQFGNLTLPNPVGIAAGFDKNAQTTPLLAALGCGFVTIGSVTLQPRRGNPRPWFYRLPRTKSLVVNAGLANDGVEAAIANLRQTERQRGSMPVIASVALVASQASQTPAAMVDEALQCADRLVASGQVAALEFNISCPNVCDDQLFSQPAQFQLLAQAITARGYNLPVTIKMPLTHSDTQFDDLLAIASQHAIDGLTIANLEKDRQRVRLHDELPPRVPGGLSGAVTYQRSNQLIARARSLYGQRFFIIGVGGIFSPADARAKLAAGADAVALITGMMFTGPQLMASIVADIPPTTPVTPTESHPQSPRHIKSQKKS